MSFYNGKIPNVHKTEHFTFRPLGPEYAELDYEAIIASKDDLERFGFDPITPDLDVETNRAGLAQHTREMESGVGYCYTVLSPNEDRVEGCIYSYGSRWIMEGLQAQKTLIDETEPGALACRFWIRTDRLADERLLLQTIIDWFKNQWEFPKVYYATHDQHPRQTELYESLGMVKRLAWDWNAKTWMHYHFADD